MGAEPGTVDRFGGVARAIRRRRTRTRRGTLRDASLPGEVCGAVDAVGGALKEPADRRGGELQCVMPALHICQILNHYTSPQDLDPDFGVRDNSANERPDWFEYWPIRKFLLNEPLD